MRDELDTVPSAPKGWPQAARWQVWAHKGSGADDMFALLVLIYLLRGEENTNEVIRSPSKVGKHSRLTGVIYCLSAVSDSNMLTYSGQHWLDMLFVTQVPSSLFLSFFVYLSMPPHPSPSFLTHFSIQPSLLSNINSMTIISQQMFYHPSLFIFTDVLYMIWRRILKTSTGF